MKTFRILLPLAPLALAAAAQAQVVANGSFETYDATTFAPTSWTATAGVTSVLLVGTFNGTTGPTDGSRFALFGAGSASDSLRQTLPTSAGVPYRVSFDLSPISSLAGNATPTSTFTVSFGGQTLLSLVDPAPTGYVSRSFDVTSVAGGDLLAFASTTPNFDAFFALDNVKVVPLPEPAPLAALSLGALALLRRRR